MTDTTISILGVFKDQISGAVGKVGGAFGGLNLRLREISERSGDLLEKLTGLAAGVAAAISAEHSIDEAREATQAQQQLVSALRGRLEMSKKILETTRSIQEQTGVSSTELNKTAAVMLRVGLGADQVQKTLQIATDASFAFSDSIESIGLELGRLSRGGQARFLEQNVKGLKEAVAQGKTFDQLLDLIQARVKDSGAAAGQTIFGRIAAAEQDLNDKSARIGSVLARLKRSVIEGFAPAVELVAKAVESPAFVAVVSLFERFAPVLVPIAAGLGVIASAFGAVAVAGAVLSPVVTTITAIGPALLAGVDAAVALAAAIAPVAVPLALVLGIATALGLAIGAAFLKLTGNLDATVSVLKSIPGLFARATESALTLLKKLADGRLGIDDIFDVLATRLRQGLILIDAFLVTPIRSFFLGAVDTVKGFFGIVPAVAAIAITKTADLAQHTFLGVLTFIASAIDDITSTLDDVLQKIDDVAGTKLAFGGTDLASKIPKDVVDLSPVANDLDAQLQESVDKFTKSLSNASATVATTVAEAISAVAVEEGQLDDRLARSEDKHLRARAADIEKEVDQERKKSDRIVAETQSLRARIEKTLQFNRVLVDAKQLIDLSPEKIKDLFSSLTEQNVEPVKAVIDRQVQEALDRGKISVEKFLELKRALEVGVLDKQVKGQDDLRAAQERTLEGLTQQLADVRGLAAAEADRAEQVAKGENAGAALEQIQKRRLDLAQQETELVGQINDATSAIADSDEKRQAFAALLLAKEQGIADLRVDFAKKNVELLKGERDELAKSAEAITNAVGAETISREEGQFRLSAAVSKFDATLARSKEQVKDLLDIPGATADQLVDLHHILKEIDDISSVRITVKASVDEASLKASLEDAQRRLNEGVQKQGQRVELGQVDPRAAAVQATHEVQDFQRFVDALTRELDLLSHAPGISKDTLDSIDALKKQLKETAELKVDPRLGLADSIAKQADEARATLEIKLRAIGEDIDRGVTTTGEGARQGRRAFAEYSDAIDISLEALERLKVSAPEIGAQIDQLSQKLRDSRKEIAPKTDSSGDFFGGLQKGVDESITRLGDLGATGERVGVQLVEGLSDGLVDVFVRGAQSFGDFLRQFVAGILIMIAKAELFRAISAGLGAIGIPIGAAAASEGGAVDSMYRGPPGPFLRRFPRALRFGLGGEVPGVDTGVDYIPAMLRAKEWVIPPESTQYYGSRVMNWIVRRAIPRELFGMLDGPGMPGPAAALLRRGFASGGEAAGSLAGPRASAMPQAGYLPADQESLERMLHSGAPGYFRFVRANRDMVRRALGI